MEVEKKNLIFITFFFLFYSMSGGGGGGSGGSCRVVVTNIPSHVRLDEFETFLQAYGTVNSCDKASSKDQQSVIVTFDNHDQAQQ